MAFLARVYIYPTIRTGNEILHVGHELKRALSWDSKDRGNVRLFRDWNVSTILLEFEAGLRFRWGGNGAKGKDEKRARNPQRKSAGMFWRRGADARKIFRASEQENVPPKNAASKRTSAVKRTRWTSGEWKTEWRTDHEMLQKNKWKKWEEHFPSCRGIDFYTRSSLALQNRLIQFHFMFDWISQNLIGVAVRFVSWVLLHLIELVKWSISLKANAMFLLLPGVTWFSY